MKEVGFDEEEQCGYESQNYNTKYATFVREFVNHSTIHYFDFVLFYNNPDKYRIQRTESESLKLLEYINANIGFVNGAYLEKFSPDKPMEIAERIIKEVNYEYKSEEENKIELNENKEEEERNKKEEIPIEENEEEKEEKNEDKNEDKNEEEDDKEEAINQPPKINVDNKKSNIKDNSKPGVGKKPQPVTLKTPVQSNKPGSRGTARNKNQGNTLQKPISTGRPRPQIQFPIVKK